jgi:phage FluMu protein gp41
LKQKRPDFDLERGIELGATDHMKVTVSRSTTKDSDKSAGESPAKKSWGLLFAFGRR